MSKKNVTEPVTPDEGESSAVFAMLLVAALALAVIVLALKAFGVF